MIQRLQTIYLFLAVLCFALLCFLPPMQFMTQEGAAEQHMYELSLFHLVDTTDTENPVRAMSVWALAVLNITIPVVALVSIFLYKKRIVQVRLNVFNIFLMSGYYILLAVYAWFVCQRLGVEWYINVSAGIPLIGIVLTFMAIRLILKDEAMVRAADRLR